MFQYGLIVTNRLFEIADFSSCMGQSAEYLVIGWGEFERIFQDGYGVPVAPILREAEAFSHALAEEVIS